MRFRAKARAGRVGGRLDAAAGRVFRFGYPAIILISLQTGKPFWRCFCGPNSCVHNSPHSASLAEQNQLPNQFQ